MIQFCDIPCKNYPESGLTFQALWPPAPNLSPEPHSYASMKSNLKPVNIQLTVSVSGCSSSPINYSVFWKWSKTKVQKNVHEGKASK